MIKHILKQMWNKRRANAWIFLELVLVTFFMWGVIDPVYVLLSNRAIDPGYRIDNVFRLTVGQYQSVHRKYNRELDTDSIRRVHFLHMYDLVRNYPGVESAVVTNGQQYPLSNAASTSSLKYDTIQGYALIMSFYREGEFFKVFRMQDVNTGTVPDHRDPGVKAIYLTRGLERKLSPDKGLTEQNIHQNYGSDTVYSTVKGIMPGFKRLSNEQPLSTQFIPLAKVDVANFPWSSQICFRIRDGLSKERFAEQFRQEMTSNLAVGNLYLLSLTDFEAIYKQSEFEHGVTNKLRLQIGLALFFLACTFLGVSGTFWLRSDARRSETGLRMALGGSRKNILREFLAESWCITTLAWLVGIFFVLQRVYFTGFAEPPESANDDYLQNLFVPHFTIVSIIVYILMLFIALTGTWIPARQAASVQPAVALHEE
ncbi:MAG: FtsX-like permease family protein [Mediterranea sp.]|jgi:hypothetical protein|nr:FtsX-like permease family protein [Mediterranea sp.]